MLPVNNTSISIAKNPPEKSQDFAFLRAQGIRLLEELVTEQWTDFNTHDPGITILEELCFVLTELALQVNVPIANFFAADAGASHFQLLFNAPLTSPDYQKVFADSILGFKEGQLQKNNYPLPLLYFSPGLLPLDPPFITNDQSVIDTTPGSSLLKINGTYDVLLDFTNDELNSNILLGQSILLNNIPVPGSAPLQLVDELYEIEFALPYWDLTPPEWRIPANFSNLVGPNPDGIFFSNPLVENNDDSRLFSAGLLVRYNNGQEYNFGVVLRISPVNTAYGISQIPVLAGQQLLDTTDGGIVQRFNQAVLTAAGFSRIALKQLMSRRNLGEDFINVQSARSIEIALYAQIEVPIGTNLETLLCELFFQVEKLLNPDPQFASLDELLDQGQRIEEIMEGPLPQKGYLDAASFQEKKEKQNIYVSDIIGAILNINDQNPNITRIIAIKNFYLQTYLNNYRTQNNINNCLSLPSLGHYKAKLSTIKSKIAFFNGENQLSVNYDLFKQLYENKIAASRSAQSNKKLFPDDEQVKREQINLGRYYSLQNDFPSVYGIKKGELPNSASNLRKAQVKQLKGYLLLFDQVFANAFAQVKQLPQLFSTTQEDRPDQLIGTVYEVPEVAPLLQAFTSGLQSWDDFKADQGNPYFSHLLQTHTLSTGFYEKKNTVLNHLLGRFGEDFLAYDNLMRALARGTEVDPQVIEVRESEAVQGFIEQKKKFINAYASVSADRGLGFAYQGRPLSIEMYTEEIIVLGNLETVYKFNLLDAEGNNLWLGLTESENEEQAYIIATLLMDLLTSPAHYQTTLPKLIIADNLGSPLAASFSDYASAAAAAAAQADLLDFHRDTWNTSNVSGLEKRLGHLLDFSSLRRDLVAINPLDYFNINSNAGNFQFQIDLSLNGALFSLASGFSYPNALAAQNDLPLVIQSAVVLANYSDQIVGNDLVITLSDSLSNPLATINFPLADDPDPSLLQQQLVDFFIDTFGPQEGCYLLEHVLLRPLVNTNDPDHFLTLRFAAESTLEDPYSSIVSILLPDGSPSGVLAANTALTSRFADNNFRKFVELSIRRECPAHIIPIIRWVDNATMSQFQTTYRVWLDINATYDSLEADRMNALRNLLIELNNIF